MVPEGVSDGDLPGGILDENEGFEGLALGVSLGTVGLSGIGVSNVLLYEIEDYKREGSSLWGALGSEIGDEVGSSEVL